MASTVNGYVAFWNGRQTEVYAETSLKARDKAVEEFQKRSRAKKVKPYEVTVILAEKDGEPVTHDPAILG